jgi:hypothetical protein
LIFGADYQSYQGYQPITVTLLDILEPVTVGREQMGMLVYTFFPDRGYGVMEFVRPIDIVDMTLHRTTTSLWCGALPVCSQLSFTTWIRACWSARISLLNRTPKGDTPWHSARWQHYCDRFSTLRYRIGFKRLT